MNFLKKYIAYVKDRPQDIWFKRKVFGWGWTPVTWQGWLVTLVFIIAIFAFALTIDERSTPRELVFTFFLPVTLLSITFIRIAYLKGEKPKWMWGFPKDED